MAGLAGGRLTASSVRDDFADLKVFDRERIGWRPRRVLRHPADGVLGVRTITDARGTATRRGVGDI